MAPVLACRLGSVPPLKHRPLRSRVATPNAGLAVGVGGLFAGIGALVVRSGWAAWSALPEGAEVLTRRGFEQHGKGPALTVFGGVFLALGGLVFLIGLFRLLQAREVQHDRDQAAPGVSRSPVLGEEAYTLTGVLHRLGPGCFSTDPKRVAGRRLGLVLGLLLGGAVLTAVVLLFGPAPSDESAAPLVLRGVMLVAVWGGLGLAGLVVTALGRRGASSFPDLEWDDERWRLIQGGELLEGGPRSDLHAVQACAAWFRIQHQGERTTAAALELNLAWREGDEVRRANLCRGHGNLVAIARQGQELADALDLPYLFHGRSDDWGSERRRARSRRPVARGGIS